ncbi:MAG TPA: M1 family aminopeptidase [Candidatus Acidoferrales bacterium]|nr:M1 family aminopeptidase [Candidatus Acidoferrales bacterium]
MRTRIILALTLLFAANAACAYERPQDAAPSQQASATFSSPQQLYQSLSTLPVDGTRVYTVHNLILRRDGVSFTFTDGTLGFLAPVGGRTSGAVFVGRGRVFALPPDQAERASVLRFLKVPLVDIEFWQAYLRFDDDTANEIQRDLSEQKIAPSSDPTFVQNWNPVVAKLDPGSSLRILQNWLSTAPRPCFYAAFNSNVIGAFDVIVDERHSEAVLIGQPRETNGVTLFDVWTSFAAPNALPHEEESMPVDYAVDTAIAEDVSLTGATTIHWRQLRAGDRVIEFELSRFLRVSSVTDETGRPLDFFQNQDLRRQEIARRGNDALFVVLPAAATAGAEYRLRVAYHGTVIENAGNNVYFVGARGSWYPHLAGQERFASFDLNFHWPKRLTLVATGHQTATAIEGGERTGHWQTTEPIAVAGFNLGDYAAQTVAGRPVISLYANQALEQAIVARLQQNAATRLPSISSPGTIDGPGTLGLAPIPNPPAVLKQLGGKLLNSVQFFETINGPFPFPELDVSQIPGSFGQGWPGLLYLTTLVFLPPEAQQRAGLAERTQEEIEQLVPFHEVAHQWWGNVVAPASYRDFWIEEAMADYQSLMYDDSHNPSKHELQNWLARYRDILLTKAPGTNAAIEEAGPLDFGYRLDSSRTPDAYNTIVYDKGAWVIHMLRVMLRDPKARNPDARFGKMLRFVLSENRFQSLSTAQFQKTVERFMKPSMDLEGARSMEWFFDEWVRETGIPSYSLDYQIRSRGGRFEIEGALQQDNVAKVFTESVPIYAAHTQGKLELLGHVVTTGPETKFHFVARQRPSRLLIDPEHTILCRTK